MPEGDLPARLTDEDLIARLTRVPGDADIHAVWALRLNNRGEPRRAQHHLARAVILSPTTPKYRVAAAEMDAIAGRTHEAGVLLRAGLDLNPDDVSLLTALAQLLASQGKFRDAVSVWNRVSALTPSDPVPHDRAGLMLREAGELTAAIACFRRAMDLEPTQRDYQSHLAVTLSEAGQFEEALGLHQELCATDPDNNDYASRLGACLSACGRAQDAIDVLEPIMARAPDHIEAAFTLAVSRFLTGDWTNGFKEYRIRFQRGTARLRRTHGIPEWNGEPLAGRHLFIYPEQGFGDLIQFARFLPSLARQAGQLTVEVPRELMRLFQPLSPNIRFIRHGTDPGPHDLDLPMLEIGRIMGLRPDAPGPSTPYMSAPPLSLPGKGLKIGLAWAGSPSHVNDANRSIALNKLSPIFEPAGTHLFSLQMGPATAEIDTLGLTGLIDPRVQQGTDFFDTARLIAGLDAVVTVDTAIAHLAGALGKQVHVLVPTNPDWRWGERGSETPWYPTMRLYRREIGEDWTRPIADIAAALGLREDSA